MEIDLEKFVAVMRAEAIDAREMAQDVRNYREHDRLAAAVIAGICNRIAYAVEQSMAKEPKNEHARDSLRYNAEAAQRVAVIESTIDRVALEKALWRGIDNGWIHATQHGFDPNAALYELVQRGDVTVTTTLEREAYLRAIRTFMVTKPPRKPDAASVQTAGVDVQRDGVQSSGWRGADGSANVKHVNVNPIAGEGGAGGSNANGK